ncbi:MAG: serine/threonine protein kinase, partial [Gluconacetobacter diazotrophicus]|nr:serine/threonine protein kinase [Gluconacetobacter diazotrophicus]
MLARREDGSLVELGRGGMGVTYRATDQTLHHDVALKVVNPDLALDARVRTRFLREARAAAGLRHPHVASVFFFGERAEDGQLFYAMELIEGETLHARVRRGGGLSATTVLEIGQQVAGALAAAEARGLTHRDLKPANLMLVEGESVNIKVIDFGLAKAVAAESAEAAGLTGTQEFVGTPAFASPEQFNVWQEPDARSDFYALGATLWYALTGQPPFAGRTPAAICEQQLRAALPLEQMAKARV